ncbi:MAG: hypothetical protein IH956_05060 [Chloroflexi bacterium]|nr:hypothetical protein [Chloroflexota bacterium]
MFLRSSTGLETFRHSGSGRLEEGSRARQLNNAEWREYHRQVTPWELDRYLTMF